MKILFVLNNFNYGGPQKSLLNLFYELKDEDVEIDLVVLNGLDKLKEYLPDNVNLINIDSRYALLMLDKHNLKENLLKNIKHPIFVSKVIAFVIKSLLKLHDNTKAKQKFWIKNKWDGLATQKKYDYAIGVSGGHSVYFIEDYIDSGVKIGWIRTDYKKLKRNNELDAQYFSKLDGLITVSKICGVNFEKIFNIQPKVFYNSLPIKLYENIPTFKIDLNNKFTNICTICRLDYGKGLDLVLETAEIIKEKNLNIHWYIIGDGKLYEWFINEITKRGLKDIVICKGFVFNTGSIVKDMDFLVHPSRFEGKSNTIDEALYYNVPVVATNFETVYEQIRDGYNGYITEMTEESIFEKIEQLYVDTVDYNRIKNNISNEKKTSVKKSEEFLNLIQSFKGDN